MFPPLKKHALWATISVISLLILVLLFQKMFHTGWLESSILDDGRPEQYILADIQSLEVRIADKNMQIATLENSLATNPHARESMEAEIVVLQVEVADLLSQMNDLQIVLDNRHRAESQKLEEEKVLDEDIAVLTAEIEKLTAQKSALEASIASSQALLVQIEAGIPGLEGAYQAARNAATPLEVLVASLQVKIAEIEGQIAQVLAEKKSIEDRIQSNLVKKKSAEEEIVVLKTVTIPGLNTALASVTKEISALIAQITTLATAIKTAETVTLPKLALDITAKNTLISQTQVKLVAEKAKSAPSAKLIAGYEATIKTTQTSRDTLVASEMAVKKKRDEDVLKKAQFEGQKTTKETTKSSKSSLLVTANDRLKAISGVPATLILSIKNDQVTLPALSIKFTNFVKMQEPFKAQLVVKNAELGTVRANIETAKNALETAVGQKTTLSASIVASTNQLGVVSGKLSAAKGKLAEAQAKKNAGGGTTGGSGWTTGGIQQTEICTNGIDDNGDGFKDCEDSQCSQDTACKGGVGEVCDDREDNDGDQAIDCGDNECSELPACRQGCSSNNSCVEICGNEIDDNNNGEADENCPKSCVLIIVQGIDSDGSFTIDTSGYHVDRVNLGGTNDADVMSETTQTTLSNYYNNENKSEKILVTAHSLGAIAAFNAQSNFKSPDTTFHLYDAPYNYPGTNDISQLFSATLKAIVRARNGGIAAALTGDWTGGLDQPNDPIEQDNHERYKFDDQALAPSRNWIENNCEPRN